MRNELHCFFFKSKKKGFSIVEGLLGLVVLAMATMLLVPVFRGVDRASEVSRIAATMIALDANITSQLQDTKTILEGNFRHNSAFQSQLINYVNNSAPNVLRPGLKLFDQDGVSILAISPQIQASSSTPTTNSMGSIFFDREGEPCLGSSCPIRVDFEIFRINQGGLINLKAAYRVASTRPVTETGVIANLGAQSPAGSAFQLADFEHFLPKSLSAMSNPLGACPYLLRGIDSLGRPQCLNLSASSVSCPAGSTMVGYDGALKAKCDTLAVIKCPTGYVLQSFVPRTFDKRTYGASTPLIPQSGNEPRCVALTAAFEFSYQPDKGCPYPYEIFPKNPSMGPWVCRLPAIVKAGTLVDIQAAELAQKSVKYKDSPAPMLSVKPDRRP